MSPVYKMDHKLTVIPLAYSTGGRDGGGGGGGGTCYAFQKGECTRGSGCRFSHEGGGGGGGELNDFFVTTTIDSVGV